MPKQYNLRRRENLKEIICYCGKPISHRCCDFSDDEEEVCALSKLSLSFKVISSEDSRSSYSLTQSYLSTCSGYSNVSSEASTSSSDSAYGCQRTSPYSWVFVRHKIAWKTDHDYCKPPVSAGSKANVGIQP